MVTIEHRKKHKTLRHGSSLQNPGNLFIIVFLSETEKNEIHTSIVLETCVIARIV